jgi:hypothetical protein
MYFEMDAYESWYMEEPNVDEKEWAMGFHTNTMGVPPFYERTCRQTLGHHEQIQSLKELNKSRI